MPEDEHALMLNTLDLALRMAGRGEWAGGYTELINCLRRAELLRESGYPWAGNLVTRYRIAIDAFCQRYGVRA